MTLQSENERRRNQGKNAGLDSACASVADEKAAKKQTDFNNAIAYVESVTGKHYPGDLWDWLKDGQVLCEMANKIKPGIIPKVGRPGMPFREMENIDMYNNACGSIGVKPGSSFRSPDLYEKRVSYPDKIIDQILALQRVVERGPRASSSSRSPKSSYSSRSPAPSPAPARSNTTSVTRVSSNAPAPAPSPASPARAVPARTTSAPARGGVVRTTAHASVDDDVMKSETERRRQDVSHVANEAEWVGNSRSQQEKFDSMAVQQWMEAVTGIPFTNNDLWETTKSGKYLCTLVDKIKPGIVNMGRINKSSINMPFKCMENIGFFTQACLDLKIKPNNIFRAPDLYEKRVSYPKAIVNCVMALAKESEKMRTFKGPALVVQKAEGRSTMF